MAEGEAINISNAVKHTVGMRLQCRKCGAEIEITTPCTCDPSDQVFRCCGQDMEPAPRENADVGVT
ncbi:MAG TPA: hypothetical protein VKP69_18075 [Isosphaeraceae bacterium]|nr:hypothetical protein [Isosphaeraceae bacterium]